MEGRGLHGGRGPHEGVCLNTYSGRPPPPPRYLGRPDLRYLGRPPSDILVDPPPPSMQSINGAARILLECMFFDNYFGMPNTFNYKTRSNQ